MAVAGVDFTIDTFEDAEDYVIELIGADFDKAIRLANAILEDPAGYTGPQAAVTAIKMANYRYKIGIAAQYWKLKSANTKRPMDRLIKDSLMCAYDGLVEVINTLKLTARHEHEQTQARG